MECKLTLVFLIYMIYQQTGAQQTGDQDVTCGKNENAVKCPKECPTDFCPKSNNQNQTCPEQTCDKNVVACKCAFNYRRENGKCIKTEDCPPFPCGCHQRYVACPAYCPTDSCADVRLNGTCPYRIGLRLECFPKCQCKDGYARDNGTCVPKDRCPA